MNKNDILRVLFYLIDINGALKCKKTAKKLIYQYKNINKK